MKADTLIVIPARYDSSRFPGKPLVDIGGKSMIRRVYERCAEVDDCEVWVATDDDRIYSHVEGFGGNVMMTSKDHQSGTERVVEVARKLEHFPLVINVQGDEPFISPRHIQAIRGGLIGEEEIVTLAKPCSYSEELASPDVVKLVLRRDRIAIYFSRSLIPYPRKQPEDITYYKHIGVYGFHRSSLLRIPELPYSPLEAHESLEQLRWLENGYHIKVVLVQEENISVDTPEDLEKLKEWMAKNGELG